MKAAERSVSKVHSILKCNYGAIAMATIIVVNEVRSRPKVCFENRMHAVMNYNFWNGHGKINHVV